MWRRSGLVIAALAAMTLGGCGSSERDETFVRQLGAEPARQERLVEVATHVCDRTLAVPDLDGFVDLQRGLVRDFPDVVSPGGGLLTFESAAWRTYCPEAEEKVAGLFGVPVEVFRSPQPAPPPDPEELVRNGQYQPGSGYPPGSPEYQTCMREPTNPICGG